MTTRPRRTSASWGRTIDELIALIELQQGLLISIATGGPTFESVAPVFQGAPAQDQVRAAMPFRPSSSSDLGQGSCRSTGLR